MNLQFYVEKLKNSEIFKNFMKEHPDAFLCSGFFIIDKTVKEGDKQHFDYYLPNASLPNSRLDIANQKKNLSDVKTLANPKLTAHSRLQMDDVNNEKTKLSSDINNFNNNTSKASAIKEDKSKREGKIMSIQLENMQLVPIENFAGVLEEVSFEYDVDFEDVEQMIEAKMKREGIKNKIQKMLLSLQKIDGRDFLVGTIFISMLGMIAVHIDLQKMEITGFEKKSLLDIVKVTRGK